MIVVIPKSTQRIDFTMTLIMMNGYTPGWAHLKWLLLNPCPPRLSSFPQRIPHNPPPHPDCSLSLGTQSLPAGARLKPGPALWVPLSWVTSSF